MENNPCEKERAELEEAKTNLQTHLADPLNRYEENPESYQKETARLRAEIKEKEEIQKNCLEKNQ